MSHDVVDLTTVYARNRTECAPREETSQHLLILHKQFFTQYEGDVFGLGGKARVCLQVRRGSIPHRFFKEGRLINIDLGWRAEYHGHKKEVYRYAGGSENNRAVPAAHRHCSSLLLHSWFIFGGCLQHSTFFVGFRFLRYVSRYVCLLVRTQTGTGHH